MVHYRDASSDPPAALCGRRSVGGGRWLDATGRKVNCPKCIHLTELRQQGSSKKSDPAPRTFPRLDGGRINVTWYESAKIKEITLEAGDTHRSKSFTDDLQRCQRICDFLGLEFKHLTADKPWRLRIVEGHIKPV